MSIASSMADIASGKKHGGIAEMASASEHKAEQGGEGAVPEHLRAMHAKMGGKHMHVHSDGMTHTSHQVGEDGNVEGPHDHENIEALKEHMSRFLDEEQNEDEGGGSEEHGGRDSLY